MNPAPFNVPVTWSNQRLLMYHGTLATSVPSIVAGVQPSKGRGNTDFGIGFYATTSLVQAKSWAWQIAGAAAVAGNLSARAAVMSLTVDRDALSRLASLSFVRGDRDAEDFWSFVFHCRSGGAGHLSATPGGFYDVVFGPVAAFWQQRVIMQDADQISFHTTAAAALLKPDPSATIYL